MKNFKLKLALIIGILLLPVSVFAQNSTTPTAPIQTVQQLLNLLCNVFGWMFYGLIALAVVMIVVAAFNYVTSNGSAEKVVTANKMILYSAIGIAVALLAKGVPLIVGDFLGASSGVSACGGNTSVNSTIQYGGQAN